MTPPRTSVSLIKTLSADSASARWAELYSAYEGPMRSYLERNFPSLEADDIIQETMAALVERLPRYTYAPDGKGHFRNYLIGILKHKAMDELRRRRREADFAKECPPRPDPGEEERWRREALEVAIEQLMADSSVNLLHRTVFNHVALMHEKPEEVAERFGLTRGNVDQIKRRLMAMLAALARAAENMV